MRNLIGFIILLFILNSCVKEPNLISAQELQKQNAKLYCYDSYDRKYYPDINIATLNDSAIAISVQFENINSYRELNFTMFTSKINVGKTFFNGSNYRDWAVSIYDTYNFSYSRENNNSGDFLEITEIDRVNKTISGNFKINTIFPNELYGEINKLPYSAQYSKYDIISSIKIQLDINDNDQTLSSFYNRFYITAFHSKIDAYIDQNIQLEFNKPFALGTHDFSYQDNELKLHTYKEASNMVSRYYYYPVGTYTMSELIINEHKYKKIVIDAYLSKYSNSYLDQHLELNNVEILIY